LRLISAISIIFIRFEDSRLVGGPALHRCKWVRDPSLQLGTLLLNSHNLLLLKTLQLSSLPVLDWCSWEVVGKVEQGKAEVEVGCQLLSRVFLEHSSSAEEDRHVSHATPLFQHYCSVAGFPVL
jgi:hypothetical protein